MFMFHWITIQENQEALLMYSSTSWKMQKMLFIILMDTSYVVDLWKFKWLREIEKHLVKWDIGVVDQETKDVAEVIHVVEVAVLVIVDDQGQEVGVHQEEVHLEEVEVRLGTAEALLLVEADHLYAVEVLVDQGHDQDRSERMNAELFKYVLCYCKNRWLDEL